MLQPEPQSGESCNTLSHEGLANVNIRKRILYRHCYIPSFQTQAVPNYFIQLYAKNVHRSIMKRTTNSHQIGGNRKRQYYRRTLTKNSKKNTEFLFAISRQTGENWQAKTLVVAISDSRSSIVRQEFSIAAYPVWKHIFL